MQKHQLLSTGIIPDQMPSTFAGIIRYRHARKCNKYLIIMSMFVLILRNCFCTILTITDYDSCCQNSYSCNEVIHICQIRNELKLNESYFNCDSLYPCRTHLPQTIGIVRCYYMLELCIFEGMCFPFLLEKKHLYWGEISKAPALRGESTRDWCQRKITHRRAI